MGLALPAISTAAADTARKLDRRQRQLSHLHRRQQRLTLPRRLLQPRLVRPQRQRRRPHPAHAPEDVHPRQDRAQRQRLAREAVGIFRSLAQISSKSVSVLIGVRRGGRPTAATRHWRRDHGLKSSPRGRPPIFILEQKILKLFRSNLERRDMNGQK